MSWKKCENKRKDARKSDIEARTLKFCMPPAAPAGVTFDNVIEQEYKCIAASSAYARECCRSWKKMPMYVSPGDPRQWYREKPCEIKPQVHIGQLKLFLSELKFLLEFAGFEKMYTVVYAGAADGHHIAYLAQLFPNLAFHLYDPNPFSKSLDNLANVYTWSGASGWFTESTASAYSNFPYNKLFISDIRSGAPMPGVDFDACCAKDMDSQLTWMRAMKPVAAMFKFRLSYKPGKTKWLAPCDPNHLFYGVFASKSATEMRLVSTDGDKMCEYDNTEMEERAYYFNNFTRIGQYGVDIPGFVNHPMKEAIGMDDCWDCCAMREICLEFLSAKWESEFGVTCEVVEVISAAVAHLIDFVKDLSDIVAGYVSPVDEQELYGFIGAVIANCGSNANYKLCKLPHGDFAHGQQWVDRMDKFRGMPISVKKNRTRLQAPIIAEIGRMYTRHGRFAPPLGKYPTGT